MSSDSISVTARCTRCGGQNLRIPGASDTDGVVDSADMVVVCRDCGNEASLAACTVITGVSDERRVEMLREVSFDLVLCWDCDPEAPDA